MLVTASATFTRPNDTTAYAANDLVANSTTAGSVTPMSFIFPAAYKKLRIHGVQLRKSGTTAANGNFHLRLYTASPTVANGDNGAWSSNKVADYIGKLDPAIMEAFTDGCAIAAFMADGSDIHVNLGSGQTVYGLLVADAAYTPAANEVFTALLYADGGH